MAGLRIAILDVRLKCLFAKKWSTNPGALYRPFWSVGVGQNLFEYPLKGVLKLT
jgi:hypothetical protein